MTFWAENVKFVFLISALSFNRTYSRRKKRTAEAFAENCTKCWFSVHLLSHVFCIPFLSIAVTQGMGCHLQGMARPFAGYGTPISCKWQNSWFKNGERDSLYPHAIVKKNGYFLYMVEKGENRNVNNLTVIYTSYILCAMGFHTLNR